MTKSEVVAAIDKRRGPIVANRIARSQQLSALPDDAEISPESVREWVSSRPQTFRLNMPHPLSDSNLQLVWSIVRKGK
ncbi:hypothetical protein HYR54_12575 [Candidatus Acetothermia bacterium]|nr:hypothetical protein [Candidatus Acetothermia bacterium]